MKQKELIAFASSFSSFLLSMKDSIKRIILFGSVARDQHDEESDIDLFVETKTKKEDFTKLAKLFEQTPECRKFRILGIKNEISIHSGDLDKRADLKRSMLNNGIILFDQFSYDPEESDPYVLFSIEVSKKDRKSKVKVWRELYGYSQKVGKKTYITKGIIQENKGIRLGPGVFILEAKNSEKISEFLRKNRIKYRILELWSDSPMLKKNHSKE